VKPRAPAAVYVVIDVDRHLDPDAFVFADLDSAMEWARTTAREKDLHGVLDEELSDPMREIGWLYYACYSIEGDDLCVVEREVQTHA